MTELRHLQLTILNIMRDVDELCRNNNIPYYLIGGSALGAMRHKGFIPWDDDLDIGMKERDYHRFLNVAKQQLDPKKYYIQEGLVDWPMYFSKIKLRDTFIKEKGGSAIDDGKSGIFLDVFKLDSSPNGRFSQVLQYSLAKYFTCYQLAQRNYKAPSFKKKMMVMLSFPLNSSFLRKKLIEYVNQWNKYNTNYLGFFYSRTNFKTSIVESRIYGVPKLLPFEDMQLPVPECCHEYLTQMFGDYMTPPPVEKQVGLHLIDVDFGKY